VLMGVLDPIGREILSQLQEENKYDVGTLLNSGSMSPFKSRFQSVNAVDASDVENAIELLHNASAVIMAFEKPADTGTLRYLLGHAAEGSTPLKRFILLSRTGISRRGNFGAAFFKNLIGRDLDKYADLEELLQKGADALKVDFTVVRTGKLRLGPDSFNNPDLLAVAEEQLFETKFKAVELPSDDEKDGDSSRADVSEAIVEALTRPTTANKIFSVLNAEGKEKGSWDNLFKSI